MRYRTFVTFNVLGALLWAVGVTLLGYTLGKTAPGIDKADLLALGGELLNQLRHSFHGQSERRNVGNLGADVQADAGHLEIFVGGRSPIKLRGSANGDAEFVLLQAG